MLRLPGAYSVCRIPKYKVAAHKQNHSLVTPPVEGEQQSLCVVPGHFEKAGRSVRA
jgi:hypothetical protein